ncbi:MAG: hypothetical protein V2I66_02820 [Halieaceae bacterium]|jgi:hypothetical protein|nr:hypothetical protein [Halieaceae bacterium]
MPDKLTDATEISPPSTLPVPGDAAPEASRGRRAAPGVIDELLVGQVFLVQATIESAAALGDSLQDVRKALYGDGEMGDVLKRTGRAVFQPYRERIHLFRQLPRQR